MVDVRLTRFAQLAGVRLSGESVGAPNRFDIWRRQVFANVVEKRLGAARPNDLGGRHGGPRVYN
jgi:DNA-binding transcriptional regulator/RsmH inhibitor MraZ